MAGSLLGTAVSEDITDADEVVILVELIQISRREGTSQGCETLYHHLVGNHAPGREQIYLGNDIVSDRRGTRSENVVVRPERASNELEILSPVSPSPDGP